LPKVSGEPATAIKSHARQPQPGQSTRRAGVERPGDRPDRIEPRAVKRRPKNYPKLSVPRAEARRRLKRGATRVGKKR
jgi:hypothetical protein